jgi:acyl carrier protein
MQDQIIAIVAGAIGVQSSSLDKNSSSGNTPGWDSLGHLAVLDALDKEFPGITGKAPELSGAESISEIVEVLNRHL